MIRGRDRDRDQGILKRPVKEPAVRNQMIT